MKSQDRANVASIIEQNTERVALGELAAKGRSHVRVISGTKALELIEAVVDRTIARRAGQVAAEDRERIVAEANEQFHRVATIQAESEGLIEQQRELIANHVQRIGDLEQRYKDAVSASKRRERRLANARGTIMNYDAEIDRLAAQVRVDADVIRDLKDALQATTRGNTADIASLRDELATLLAERDASSTAQLEQRFEASMDRTLDKISRTLHSATARPVDNSVEATDALIGRIFDNDADMETNLGALDVTVSTAEDGIAKSLERLRRLRGGEDPSAGESGEQIGA